MPLCCPPGSWPQLLQSRDQLNAEERSVPERGVLVSIPSQSGGGSALPVYVVEPPEGTAVRGGILVFQDIYSVRVLKPSVRSGDRIGILCDTLAEAGYVVALPSIFRDEPFDVAISGPDDGDFEKFNSFAQNGGVAWFQKQNYDKVGPDVKAAYEFLKTKIDGKPVGGLGFCYGCWLLSKASSTGDIDLVAGVGCHPATVLEEAVFGGSEVGMLKALKQPTRFLWAGNDSETYLADGDGRKAVEATGGDVIEFPDMLHGWVSRGDVSEAKVKRDVEKAMELILIFLDEKMNSAK